MSLRTNLLYFVQAWRILPRQAKGLLLAGYGVSAFIYWSSTIATPSDNAGCLTGPCQVTVAQIEQTRITSLVLIGLISVMWVVSLIVIARTLERKEERSI